MPINDFTFQAQAAPTDKFVQHGLRIGKVDDTLGQFSRAILGSQQAITQLSEMEIKKRNAAEEQRADMLAAELGRMDTENISKIAEGYYEEANSAVFNNRLAAKTAAIGASQYQRALVQSFSDRPINHNDPQGFSNRVKEIRDSYLADANPYYEQVFLEQAAPREGAAFNHYESMRGSFMRDQAETAVQAKFGLQLSELTATGMTPAQRAVLIENMQGSLQAEFNNGVTSNSANATLYRNAIEAYATDTGDTGIFDELGDTKMFGDAPIKNTQEWQAMERRVINQIESKRDRESLAQARQDAKDRENMEWAYSLALLKGEEPSPAMEAYIGVSKASSLRSAYHNLVTSKQEASNDTPEARLFLDEAYLKIANGTLEYPELQRMVDMRAVQQSAIPALWETVRENKKTVQLFEDDLNYTTKLGVLKKSIVDSYTGQGEFVYNDNPYQGSQAEAMAQQLYQFEYGNRYAEYLKTNGVDVVPPNVTRTMAEDALQAVLQDIGVKTPLQAGLPTDADANRMAAQVAQAQAAQSDPDLLSSESFAEKALQHNIQKNAGWRTEDIYKNQNALEASGLMPNGQWEGLHGEFALPLIDPEYRRATQELAADIRTNGVAPGYINRLPVSVIREVGPDFQWFTTVESLESAMSAFEGAVGRRDTTSIGRLTNILNLRGPVGVEAFVGMQYMRLHALDRQRTSLQSKYLSDAKRQGEDITSSYDIYIPFSDRP